MDLNEATETRPVYRHIIVNRRGYCQPAGTAEQFRRLRQQLESGRALDADIQHLYVADTLRKSREASMVELKVQDDVAKAGPEGLDLQAVHVATTKAREMAARGELEDFAPCAAQSGVIVSQIIKNQVPGGNDEPLPVNPMVLHHPGFDQAENVDAQYLECALQLRQAFQAHSDRKFLLVDPDLCNAVTLVTVCLTPITACPRATVGMELFCEFHQVTRFGYVDTEGFEVISETGEYPIMASSAMDLRMMMLSADEILGKADSKVYGNGIEAHRSTWVPSTVRPKA